MANGFFSRLRGVAKAHADRRLEALETPDVLIRNALRKTEEDLGRLQAGVVESRQREIASRWQISEARKKGAVLRERSSALMAAGNEEGALFAMQRALLHEYNAEMLERQGEELHRMNEALTTQIARLSQQRAVLAMQAQIEQARYSTARAGLASAEAMYGKPGEIGSSPREALEEAQRKSQEIAARGLAILETGQRTTDTALIDAEPDFSEEARLALGLGSSGRYLPGAAGLVDASPPAPSPLGAADGGSQTGGGEPSLPRSSLDDAVDAVDADVRAGRPASGGHDTA